MDKHFKRQSELQYPIIARIVIVLNVCFLIVLGLPLLFELADISGSSLRNYLGTVGDGIHTIIAACLPYMVFWSPVPGKS